MKTTNQTRNSPPAASPRTPPDAPPDPVRKASRRPALLAALLGLSAVAQAQLNVVATLPDFGAIAAAVGGDRVKVTVLAKGTEDSHFVDPRPSFIRVLNQADVLLESGAELEIGWLPPLVNAARNARIQPGQPGRVRMSEGVRLLEVPEAPADRSQGDVHPAGNPHFWLEPANGPIMAEHLAETFAALDPAHAEAFRAQAKRFSERLNAKLAEWTKRMAPYRGARLLTYHKSYEYLAARFGLEIVGQLEPKPGIEPSPAHINSLIARAREQGVKLVVIEPFRPRRTAERVAEAVGAALLVLPEKVGGNEKVKDSLGLFDYAVEQLASALEPP